MTTKPRKPIKKQPEGEASLSPKIMRFVEEYVIDGNGTQAAIRAGYSERSAYAQASALLKKHEVKAELEKRLAEVRSGVKLTRQTCIEQYRRLASACYNQPLHELDDDTAAALTFLTKLNLSQRQKNVRLSG